jgi:hypothetical protein
MDYTKLPRARRVTVKHVFVPGDHLFYPGAFDIPGLSHHGVYVGNGQVAHFFPVRLEQQKNASQQSLYHIKKESRVHLVPVEDFRRHASGRAPLRDLYVYEHDPRERLPRVETVNRCLSRLGQNNYNAVTNNCEHFVNNCVLGRPVSVQVDKLLDSIAKE